MHGKADSNCLSCNKSNSFKEVKIVAVKIRLKRMGSELDDERRTADGYGSLHVQQGRPHDQTG